MSELKIRILGISGTPVKDGNCDKLVQESLKAAEEVGNVDTDFITLADKSIAMCQHCQYCIQNKTACKIQDDAQMIYEKIKIADGIILASPVWLRTLAPPIMILFSRTRSIIFYSHEFRNKVAGAIAVGWFGRGMENTLSQLKLIMERYMMIPIADGSAISSTFAFGERADYMPGGALDHKVGVRSVRNVGYRVAEIARMIKFATDAGIGVPPEFQIMATGAALKRKSKGKE